MLRATSSKGQEFVEAEEVRRKLDEGGERFFLWPVWSLTVSFP